MSSKKATRILTLRNREVCVHLMLVKNALNLWIQKPTWQIIHGFGGGVSCDFSSKLLRFLGLLSRVPSMVVAIGSSKHRCATAHVTTHQYLSLKQFRAGTSTRWRKQKGLGKHFGESRIMPKTMVFLIFTFTYFNASWHIKLQALSIFCQDRRGSISSPRFILQMCISGFGLKMVRLNLPLESFGKKVCCRRDQNHSKSDQWPGESTPAVTNEQINCNEFYRAWDSGQAKTSHMAPHVHLN